MSSSSDSDIPTASAPVHADRAHLVPTPVIEEPVLSHKAARKSKKRKLDQVVDGGAAAEGKEKTVAQANAAAAQGKRTAYGVWIGNMSFKTDSFQLKNWLAGCGEIARCHMPAGTGGKEVKNKGFAYVDFETEAGQQAAVAKSEDHLDGRRLLIKASSDFQGRPKPSTSENSSVAAILKESNADATSSLSKTARKIAEKQKNPVGPTLFIGNLGFETTEEVIKTMFDAHYRAALKWEPRARKSKTKKTASASDSSSNSGSSSSSSESEEEEEEKRETVAKLAPGERKTAAGIRKVRMGTFEDTGKCKGFAFVDFHTPKGATLALLNPHNHRLNGRDLKVEYASADAVRRGGYRAPPKPKVEEAVEKEETPMVLEDLSLPPKKKHKPTQEERMAARKVKKVETKKVVKPKTPGAALASAPKERIGIVTGGGGKKITFD